MEKRLMVVDDDPDILISIRKIFEREGYEVLTVDTGHDCVKEIERGFKGVILIDIMMPFLDGWDTIEQILKRGLTKDVIISILTAKGTPDHEKMKGLEGFIYDYITKPFDISHLKEIVSSQYSMLTKNIIKT
jgi:DNA-binding response OmpR family regulator